MMEQEQTEKMMKERNEIKDIMKLLDKCVSLNPMCKSKVATVIYGNNYRKLPEDSVVLSREELQMRDYEHYNLGYETHRQESQKREDYIKTLCHHINDLENALLIERKQVVKEFAEKLKKYSIKTKSPEWGSMEFVELNDIDDLLKEYEK